MSKYIKLDVEKLKEEYKGYECIFAGGYADCDDCPLCDSWYYCRILDWLESLPTIEVSDKADRPFEYFEGFEDGKASVEVSEEELKGCDKVDKRFSEDAISREYLKSFEYINKGDFNSVETIREWIDNAPSVIPQPKESEWILECDAEGEGDNLYRCPKCGQKCGCQEYDLPNFCGNCGTKMRR